MGIGGISMWQLLILLLIVVLVFGSLRNMGSDLGAAVKGFRKGMDDAREETLEPDKISSDQRSESASEEPARNKESSA